MPKFRKKPIVIEAEQLVDACYDTMLRHFGEEPGEKYGYIIGTRHPAGPVSGMMSASSVNAFEMFIKTLEGNMIASYGDWIIKGVSSEQGVHFWPVKPDYFRENYEEVINEDVQ